MKHRYLKKLRVAIGLVAMIAFATPIFLYFHHRISSPPFREMNVLLQRYKPQLITMGFRYDRNCDGKKILSIKADRFTIDKKKLGPLKFSLMNVARFDNVFIQIFGTSRRTENSYEKLHVRNMEDLTFKDAFSKKTLSSFPVKRISSLILKPIYVEIYDEQSLVTSISSASAALGLTNRNILFRGAVRVVSNARVLTADRLILQLEKPTLRILGRFSFKTHGKQWEGNQLITDIFLRPVTS